MRIISGTLKGKTISFLKSTSTRPLKDSVKENIFNIIFHSKKIDINFDKSNILDLYSGVGSFGLECISRGAKKIVFVEKDKQAVGILKKNLFDLSISNKANIFFGKIENFLKNKGPDRFDLIFLDPPFAEKTYIKELYLIKERKIFKKNHLIIIHREKKSEDNFENILDPMIIKYYGRSKIIFGKFLS